MVYQPQSFTHNRFRLTRPHGFERTVFMDDWSFTPPAGFPSLLIVEGAGEVWMWAGGLLEG